MCRDVVKRGLLALILLAAVGPGWADWQPERIYTVGFAQDTMSNDWRAAQVNEMRAALAAYPYIRFVYTDAGGSTARQAYDLERLASNGVDVLVTSPRDSQAMTPVIDALYEKGLPVVLLTRRSVSDSYSSFIGADDRAIGREAAEHIATELGGQGRIVMIRGLPTATTAIARSEGFEERLKDYPGLQIVAAPVANYKRADAVLAMEEVLASGIAFDAIYAQSDGMASGARMAMRANGIDPATVVIVGIDYIPEAREAIRNGEQSASFTYPTAAREGAQTALRIIQDLPVDKEQMVPFTKVTIENVDSVEPIFPANVTGVDEEHREASQPQ